MNFLRLKILNFVRSSTSEKDIFHWSDLRETLIGISISLAHGTLLIGSLLVDVGTRGSGAKRKCTKAEERSIGGSSGFLGLLGGLFGERNFTSECILSRLCIRGIFNVAVNVIEPVADVVDVRLGLLVDLRLEVGDLAVNSVFERDLIVDLFGVQVGDPVVQDALDVVGSLSDIRLGRGGRLSVLRLLDVLPGGALVREPGLDDVLVVAVRHDSAFDLFNNLPGG